MVGLVLKSLLFRGIGGGATGLSSLRRCALGLGGSWPFFRLSSASDHSCFKRARVQKSHCFCVCVSTSMQHTCCVVRNHTECTTCSFWTNFWIVLHPPLSPPRGSLLGFRPAATVTGNCPQTLGTEEGLAGTAVEGLIGGLPEPAAERVCIRCGWVLSICSCELCF